MKRILAFLVLVSTFLFVYNHGISYAIEPISLIDAEILLSKIKADRDTVVQNSFGQLLLQYRDIEPPEDPAITTYMAACIAEKSIQELEIMSPQDLVDYSNNPELSSRNSKRVATECWGHMQALREKQSKEKGRKK
jgi:hypothetical protein